LVGSRGVGGGHTAPRSTGAAGQDACRAGREGDKHDAGIIPETSRAVLPPL
jgi:hypothetical protein